jgi:hypothetical protein
MYDVLKRDCNRFLDGIEQGKMTAADSYNLLRQFDPLLGYFLLFYLREKHHVTDMSSGAGERLLGLVSTYPEAAKIAKRPARDSIVEWFEDAYSAREFFGNRDAFVELIVEKLEG